MRKLVILVTACILFLNAVTAASDVIKVGETENRTFTVEGFEHEIDLRYIDGGAAVTLDGFKTEYPNHLEQGDYFSGDGIAIQVKKVVPQGSSGNSQAYINFTAQPKYPHLCAEVDGCRGHPSNPDDDQKVEDVNGNGQVNMGDVNIMGKALPVESLDQKKFYDFNEDGKVDYSDVKQLSKEASPNNPLGFQKQNGDWRDENGDYSSYTLDLDQNSYVGIDDVIDHWNSDAISNDYDPNQKPEELKLDYNCDEKVDRQDSNLLFNYAMNNGDVSIGDQGLSVTGCDYDGDGTAYVNEQADSGFNPQDLDGDGLYEDVNGDNAFDEVDVQKLDTALENSVVTSDDLRFDFSGDQKVNQTDVNVLFDRASGQQQEQPSLSCSDVKSSQLVKFYDSDDDGQLSSGELSVGMSEWRAGEISNQELQKIKYAYNNDCDVSDDFSMTCSQIKQQIDLSAFETDDGNDLIDQAEVKEALQSYRDDRITGREFQMVEKAQEKSCTVQTQTDAQTGPAQQQIANTRVFNLSRGWNMVSIPGQASSTVSEQCDVREFRGKPFWSLSGTGSAESPWNLHTRINEPNRGYLVYLESSCNAQMPVGDQASDFGVDLDPGWNTVSVTEQRSMNSVDSGCNFQSELWTLDSSALKWQKKSLDQQLDPMKGYYVKVGGQCSIN